MLVIYCRATGFSADLRRYWRQYLVIGAVNSTLPFVLYAFVGVIHQHRNGEGDYFGQIVR